MTKMLSLAAMFAVLSYASPASAELKLGGDASVRIRSELAVAKAGTASAGKSSDAAKLKEASANSAAQPVASQNPARAASNPSQPSQPASLQTK